MIDVQGGKTASRSSVWQCLLGLSQRWEPVVTIIAAVAGVGLYIWEWPAREEARNTAAWEVLASQSDRTGNGGPKWAMGVLVQNGVDMHGLHLINADLSDDLKDDGSRYNSATLHGAKLNWSMFWRSNLGGADLSDAELMHADFTCSMLSNVNFGHAHLRKANFASADVSGVNFNGADLSGADLSTACVDAPSKTKLAGWTGTIQRICGAPPVTVYQHCGSLAAPQ